MKTHLIHAFIIISLVLCIQVEGFSTELPSQSTQEYIHWEAENFKAGNWTKEQAGVGAFDPKNAQQANALSGGKWLSARLAEDIKTVWAEYSIAVPTTNEYNFYVRRFYFHGKFRYRFDDNEWINIDTRRPLIDRVNIRFHVTANWQRLEPVKLEQGNHRFTVELLKVDGEPMTCALDCFLLSPEIFIPHGTLLPGQKNDTADPNTWAFQPEKDQWQPSAVLDLRRINENIAGEHGYIRASGDGESFVQGDGTDIRFWTSNVANIAVDDETMQYAAKHLAKRGVNLVRIHDHHERPWSSKPDAAPHEMNEEAILNYQRAVEIYAREGIYSKLSLLSSFHKYAKHWKIPGAGTNKNQFFSLVYYVPELQHALKTWLRAILTNPSPYGNTPLAQNPALAMVEILNEDSLLFWTFPNNVDLEHQKIIGAEYMEWLQKRYGSFSQALDAWGGASALLENRQHPKYTLLGDHPKENIAGFLEASALHATWSGNKKRATDQLQFLAEYQHLFYTEMAAFIREDLQCQAMIVSSAWRTVDDLHLLDLERWTYTGHPNHIVDSHSYVAPPHENPQRKHMAKHSVNAGDGFVDISVLHTPRLNPVRTKLVQGSPVIISEGAWNNPMSYKSEAPLLISAYSSLCGLDGFMWFRPAGIDWDSNVTKFQVSSPDVLAAFPAAALIFRKGWLKEGTPVIIEGRTPASMFTKTEPLIAEDSKFDAMRDGAYKDPLLQHSKGLDPLAFLVGPVKVDYSTDEDIIHPYKNLINHHTQTVTSNTGEISLNWKTGLLKIQADHAEGASGFLKASGPLAFDTLHLQANNAYASVVLVPLDDAKLKDSHSLLLQINTKARLHGWKEEEPFTFTDKSGKQKFTGKKIISLGNLPWNVENSDMNISIHNTHITQATLLDINGYPLHNIDITKDNIGIHFATPHNALYIHLH